MVRIVTLINGEQLIGEIEDFSESIKMFRPFYIVDAVTEDGAIGSKLTNVLTFSASEYIVIHKDKIVFDFPAKQIMIQYYKKLIEWYNEEAGENIIKQALDEMEQSEKRYQKLLQMLKPDKSQLN